MDRLPSLEKLVSKLRRLPYLASKNVFRVAFALVDKDPAEVQEFCNSILQAAASLKHCRVCFSWVEARDICALCADPKRDASFICVVASWFEQQAIERSSDFKGVFHILGGLISPLDGIGADQLTIAGLIDRVKGLPSGEIFFALNSTPQGEVTAAYVAEKIVQANPGLRLSRLASGVPAGSAVEFIDHATMSKAILLRQVF